MVALPYRQEITEMEMFHLAAQGTEPEMSAEASIKAWVFNTVSSLHFRSMAASESPGQNPSGPPEITGL